MLAQHIRCKMSASIVAFWDRRLPKYGKCLTTSSVVPGILISGGASVMPGADWYMSLVFLMLMESARLDSARSG